MTAFITITLAVAVVCFLLAVVSLRSARAARFAARNARDDARDAEDSRDAWKAAYEALARGRQLAGVVLDSITGDPT